MVVVLSGGAGGGRFCRGVVRAVPADQVTIIANTADDIEVYGVEVCPDVDLVTFTLAGVLDVDRGYGLAGDARLVMEELRAQGIDTWFDLGDRDLAICVARTEWLRRGIHRHEIASRIAARFGLVSTILPMTNDKVWTEIDTSSGPLHFQRWWVGDRANTPPLGVRFVGTETATPGPGVLEALKAADTILLAPSNPVVSIGAILSIPGIKQALIETSAPVVAVTPIVGGQVLRGMADKLLRAHGVEVSAAGVASMYQEFADGFVIDETDKDLADRISEMGLEVGACDTIMVDDEATTILAKQALTVAERIRT